MSLSCQASLNSSMDSLKVELNTALQCDREAEDEVKKLKVRGNASKMIINAHIAIITTMNMQFDPFNVLKSDFTRQK